MKTLLETAEEIVESVKAERDWFKDMLEKSDAEVERLRNDIAIHLAMKRSQKAEIDQLRSALKVISTWASFDLEHNHDGQALDPEHTLHLAKKALGYGEGV